MGRTRSYASRSAALLPTASHTTSAPRPSVADRTCACTQDRSSDFREAYAGRKACVIGRAQAVCGQKDGGTTGQLDMLSHGAHLLPCASQENPASKARHADVNVLRRSALLRSGRPHRFDDRRPRARRAVRRRRATHAARRAAILSLGTRVKS
jgi:hypothetical protein